ncbi:MAG: EAL domain-containing protein [Thiobacillus sp.]|nr:EAL domain-containing protein [Thiobacillus sp.]
MAFFSHTRLPPRPIAHYALALSLILVVALAVLAVAVLHDTARLKEEVKRSDEMLARQELEEAIGLLTARAHGAAQSLMAWDEARQQLENPVYYGYWRNSRALSAGVVPETLDALDLYRADGQNLSTARAGEALMPATLDPRRLQPYMTQDGEHAHVYYFFPFYQSVERTRLLGYMGFKFDLLDELRQLRKFRYLDLDSLRSVVGEGRNVSLPDIVSTLEFQVIGNPETRALERIVSRSFYEIVAIIALISTLAYLVMVSVITKPLKHLSHHIDAMRRGSGDRLGESYRGLLAVTELENVRRSLNDYQQQLDDMHVSLAHKNQELWTQANHDPLTGALNRRAFDHDWRAMFRSHPDAPPGVAFLLFDCDHFKAINDTYGHQIGDQVLQVLAESLRGALRSGDRLYRLGGDEFVTILFSADSARARQVAERCLEQVAQHDFTANWVREPIRVSVGIALLDTASVDDLQLLHRRADIAMYYAKRPGQGKISLYAPEMGEGQEALVSNSETSAIYEAMAHPGQLEMHYQPVYGFKSSAIEYYEALVRIRGENDLIMPAHIFPVVEFRGLEAEFDLSVLEKIQRDLEAGCIPAGKGVALNVSGPGIVSDRVMEKLKQLAPMLARYKLIVEVTETSLITQIAHASSNLNQLRKLGFVIALDDFGSGYSSLRYLAGMPVDLVKFDISMVHSLAESSRQAVFVEDLARLIKDAGYQLVAEGIESDALLQRVKSLGFSHAQGFHIGRPARMEEANAPRVAAHALH